jgi:hypothetical protein
MITLGGGIAILVMPPPSSWALGCADSGFAFNFLP